MRIWLSKTSAVPLREQLKTQIVVGIVSADLLPGERLPSSSQLGRQFGIHPNTVRTAYRALGDAGWVEWRKGSGFYVREREPGDAMDPELDLDRLISTFFQVARDRGHALDQIQARIVHWLAIQPPDRVAVIEPDVELRRILIGEIQAAVAVPVVGLGLDECRTGDVLTGALPAALYDHAEEVRAVLPAEVSCVLLRSSSVPDLLAGETRPGPDTLITVVSRWPDFLRLARTFLAAVGIGSEALDLRDARRRGWKRGLDPTSLIVTDSSLVGRLPAGCNARVFPIVSKASVAELRDRLPGSASASSTRPA